MVVGVHIKAHGVAFQARRRPRPEMKRIAFTAKRGCVLPVAAKRERKEQSLRGQRKIVLLGFGRDTKASGVFYIIRIDASHA